MSIDAPSAEPASRDSPKSTAFPCTLLQARLLAQHARNGPHGLNVPMRWLVKGVLSPATVERALQSLIHRHEILRTSFRAINGKPTQVVWPSRVLKLRAVDLSSLAAGEAQARAEEIARAEAVAPMDPADAPLLRATLLQLEPALGVLLLTFHAMVVDGWAIGVLMREFDAAVQAIDANTALDLAEPELQFADYALWEKELLASDALDGAREHWKRTLHDAVGTRVAPDRAPPARGDDNAYIDSSLLPGDLGRAIVACARRHSVTLYVLGAAALALMLHRVTGDAKIVIGSQVANREEPVAENLVGPTVNSITLCLPVDDGRALGRHLEITAGIVREALQNQRLPFEIAMEFAPRHPDRALHAINLVVHRSYSGVTGSGATDDGNLELISLPSYSAGALWDLTFFLIERDEGWRMSCEADPALYDEATARNLLAGWRRCLEAIATLPADALVADGAGQDGTAGRTVVSVRPSRLRPVEDLELLASADPERQIVRFHETGTRTPVVVLNNRSVYFPLAQALGSDRPFIDIQIYPPDGPYDLPPHAFEVFGAYAVRLIRWAQPRGPYILGGHCVYGTLAVEAARQLQRMGEQVHLVALFDSWAPGYRETMSTLDKWLRLRRLQLKEYGVRLGQYRRGEIGLDRIVLKPILRRLRVIGPDPEPEKQAGQWFDDDLREAAARYRPSPYEGDAILFRSAETLRGRLFEGRMGWGPLISGELSKIELTSGHNEMFREQPARQISTAVQALVAGKEAS